MNTLAFIQSSIKSRDEITIRYHGGSHPGTARMIVPYSLKGNLLKAKENGSSKSFKMELVELVDNETHHHEYQSLLDVLMFNQELISSTDLLPVADRLHISLFELGNPIPTHYIRHCSEWGSQYPWECDGVKYSNLQSAADAFIKSIIKF